MDDTNTPPPKRAANEKFWTPELRKELLESYLKHISEGFSDTSFVGIERKQWDPEKKQYKVVETIGCTFETFKTYIQNYPEEFDSELISHAKAKRQNFWERLGIYGTSGKLQGFNAKSWEFNMKNRFKWTDRQDLTTQGDKLPETVVIYKPEKKEEGSPVE